MTGGFPKLCLRASAALPVYQRPHIFEAPATKAFGRIKATGPYSPVGCRLRIESWLGTRSRLGL